MIRKLLGLFAAAALLGSATARANDSSANLGVGGLEFVFNDRVEMRSEDLFISEKEIRVRYVFRNLSDRDVTNLVAFPMPDILYQLNYAVEIPVPDAENFLDFHTLVDGVPVKAEVERRVLSLGIDRTRLLEDLKVPLMPFGEPTEAALTALPPDSRQRLLSLGLARVESNDAGRGPYLTPQNWTLRTTYYWTQTFPAGKDLSVEHRYKPSVGMRTTSSLRAAPRERWEIEDTADYKRRYCVERDILEAVTRAGGRYTEHRISYFLTTGAYWARPIGEFTLTVDKGAPQNLVTFCGKDVRKIGPTTFQMKKKDFYPAENLEILVLKPY